MKQFIQNVHHFRDEALKEPKPPVEHVAVFDEAQRARTREMTASFMRRKKNVPDFDQSEPELLISSRLTDSEYSAGRALEAVRGRRETYFECDDASRLASTRDRAPGPS